MKTKVSTLAELNVNPCKMCMPLGAVTAFYGIKNSITILHGSQGCSTYIRRHMATHYNEPIDVASSSLTEQGTVYGGEDNLLAGLENLIQLYEPKVIGIPTTCLAETIGEDVKNIVEKFYTKHPEYKDKLIVPVSSAGYSGTHFEGYFNALLQVLSSIQLKPEKNNKVNVITGMISPRDLRFLKQAFQMFQITPIFLCDYADNLDGVYNPDYKRLPENGTDIEEIREMAGAKLTIEILGFPVKYSPGEFLLKQYGVPLKRIQLPCGIKNVNSFYELLSEISGQEITKEICAEKGRYQDAMIDSHKYNSMGRAAIFGDPDFVVTTVQLCCENGILPVVVATGADCKDIKKIVEQEIGELADKYLVDHFEILDNADFKEIEEAILRCGANIMIGNSDARRIEQSYHIPLVRRGFPIHDRVGGQRYRTFGYEGSLMFLDEITNTLLGKREASFREELYKQYYLKDNEEQHTVEVKEEQRKVVSPDLTVLSEEVRKKTEQHPCFSCGAAHNFARIHLPVAPVCNIQCNYCVRKFDCPNESRPGVTTKVLTPEEAFVRYKKAKEKIPNLSVVGIAGPGDALANFDTVKQTIQLVRQYDHDVTFCISTNGMLLPDYAKELVDLGVSHITVTCNAVNPEINAQIYRYVNYKGKKYEGIEAGELILKQQLSGLEELIRCKVACKINIVLLKGINDHHVPVLMNKLKELGCYISNIMPMIPVKGSAFEHNETFDNKEITKIRKKAEEIFPQMHHCRQCRADAAGKLDEDVSIQLNQNQEKDSVVSGKKIRYAVCSKSGLYVDQHFGQVKDLLIYEYQEGQATFIERRDIQKYCVGNDNHIGEEERFQEIIKEIEDCSGIICTRIGEIPKKHFTLNGKKVYVTYDVISHAVKEAEEIKTVNS